MILKKVWSVPFISNEEHVWRRWMYTSSKPSNMLDCYVNLQVGMLIRSWQKDLWPVPVLIDKTWHAPVLLDKQKRMNQVNVYLFEALIATRHGSDDLKVVRAMPQGRHGSYDLNENTRMKCTSPHEKHVWTRWTCTSSERWSPRPERLTSGVTRNSRLWTRSLLPSRLELIDTKDYEP